MKKVVIDAGHGGRDGGSRWADGAREKDFTLRLTGDVGEALTAGWEVEVIQTRTVDADVGLGERAEVANRVGADLFLSLHTDAGRPENRGGSMWVWTPKRDEKNGLRWLPAVASDGTANHEAPNSYRLSQFIEPVVKAALVKQGIPWRGIWCADFQVLRDTDGAGVLIECFFGTNQQDVAVAKGPSFVPVLAKAIARAVAVALTLPEKQQPKKKTLLAVQIGAFENPENAERLLKRLEAAGFAGYIVQKEVETG